MGGSGPNSLFRETDCLCMYQDSRYNLWFRCSQETSTDALSQSILCPVVNACSARADVSLAPLKTAR